jgi:MFS family permease
LPLVAEQANPKWRGPVAACTQVTLGILASFLINYAFAFVENGKNLWRWEFLITGLWPLLLMITCFFIPESAGHLEKLEKISLGFSILKFSFILPFFYYYCFKD